MSGYHKGARYQKKRIKTLAWIYIRDLPLACNSRLVLTLLLLLLLLIYRCFSFYPAATANIYSPPRTLTLVSCYVRDNSPIQTSSGTLELFSTL